MKTLLPLILIIISSFKFSFSQVFDSNGVYTVVDEMPQFPNGGEPALLQYIKKHLHYPSSARLNNIEGMVYLTFIVDKTGTVTNTKILRGLSPEIDAVALSVINNMPKWKPGKKDGKEVSVQYNLPLKFSLFDRRAKKRSYAQNQKYFKKGNKYFIKKRYEDAIENFTNAIKAKPDDSSSFYSRGLCFLNLENHMSACDDWKKAKELGNKESEELIIKYCGLK